MCQKQGLWKLSFYPDSSITWNGLLENLELFAKKMKSAAHAVSLETNIWAASAHMRFSSPKPNCSVKFTADRVI